MPAIRRQINIAAGTRAVWRALTTVDGLQSWLADTARVDAREGGRIVLTSEGDDGEPVEERGLIHEIRPTRKLEWAWDSSSPAPTAGTRVLWQLAMDGEETRVILVHRGGGPLDEEESRAAMDKEWRQALLALRDALEAE